MKNLSILLLVGSMSAVQIDKQFPKWDGTDVFEQNANLAQNMVKINATHQVKDETLGKDKAALTQKNDPEGPQPKKKLKTVGGAGEVEKMKEILKKKMMAGGGSKAKDGKKGGPVEVVDDEQEGPAPPMTKVFQKVEMSSNCDKGVCHVKECFDGKCKTYEKAQPPKFEFQQPDAYWEKMQPAVAVQTAPRQAAPAAKVASPEKIDDATKDEAVQLSMKINSVPEIKAVKTSEAPTPDNSEELQIAQTEQEKINEDIYAGKKTK